MAFWGCPVLKCKVLLRDSTFLPTDKSVQVIRVPESSFGLLSYLTTLGLGLVLTGKKLKVTLPLVADKER